MDPIKFKKAFESSPNTLFNNPDSVNEVFRQTGVDFQTQEILDNYLSENKISLDSFGLSEADSVDEKKNLVATVPTQDSNPSGSFFTGSEENGSSDSKSAIQTISTIISDYRDNEDQRIVHDKFKGITADFLDREESEVKIGIEKLFQTSDFSDRFIIKEKQPGRNALEITTKDGSDQIFVDLTPAGPPLLANKDEENAELLVQSKALRDFFFKNTGPSTLERIESFEKDPDATIEGIHDNSMKISDEYIKNMAFTGDDDSGKSIYNQVFRGVGEGKRISIDDVRLQRDRLELNLNKAQKELRRKNTPQRHGEMGRHEQGTGEIDEIKSNITGLNKLASRYHTQRSNFSKTTSQLLQHTGGLKKWAGEGKYGEFRIQSLINNGLDPRDLKMKEIQIDGASASLNELIHFTTDGTLRDAIYDEKISISVSDFNENENLEFLKPIIEKAKDLERVQLREVGSFWRGLFSVGAITSASVLETVSNAGTLLLDVARMGEEAYNYATQDIDDKGAFNVKRVEEEMDARYGSYMDQDIFFNAAQAIRKEVPETQGGISDAESFTAFFSKGADGAAESAVNMALFVFAPPVGLANIGVGSYGSSVREMTNIRRYISGTGDPQDQFRGYKDMSVWKARSLAGSKALGETLITRMFTYNFLKGLGKSTSAARPNMNQMNELTKFYSNSFANNIRPILRKSFINEFKEEELITASQMYTDQVFGVKDYSFNDYVKAMSNTALQLPFLTIPMGAAGYKAMSKSSKAFTDRMIFNAVAGTDYVNADIKFRQVDAHIKEIESEKKEVSPDYIKSLYDQRDDLSEQMVSRDDEIQVAIDNATNKDVLAKIAKNQSQVMLNNQIARDPETTGDEKERRIKHSIELYKKSAELFEPYDTREIKKKSEKKSEDLKSQTNQYSIDNKVENLTPQEQAAYLIVSTQMAEEKVFMGKLSVEGIVEDQTRTIKPFSLGKEGFMVKNTLETDEEIETKYDFYRKDANGNVDNSVYSSLTIKNSNYADGDFEVSIMDGSSLTKQELELSTDELNKFFSSPEQQTVMINEILNGLSGNLTVDYESKMPDDVVDVNLKLNAWNVPWANATKNDSDFQNVNGLNSVIEFLKTDYSVIAEDGSFRKEYDDLKKATSSSDYEVVSRAIRLFDQRVVKPTKAVRETVDALPVSGKINPITTVEALWTGFDSNFVMADVTHIISFLLKNDKMRTPLRMISGGIDATLGKNAAETDRLMKDYLNLNFLPGYRDNVGTKLTPKMLSQDKIRKEKFMSYDSNVERTIMMMMDRFDQSSTLSPEEQVSRMKKIINDNITKLNQNSSSKGKERANSWASAYKKLTDGVSNHDQFVKRVMEVSPDNYAGLQEMQKLFTPELTEATMDHMKGYYGRTPRRITRYLPMILSADNADGTSGSVDETMMQQSSSGPSSLKDLTEFDNLFETDRTIYGDNFDALVFRSYTNIKNEIGARENLDVMNGFLKHPEFRNLFDTEKRKTIGPTKPQADFDYMIDILNKKLDDVNEQIGSTGSAMLRNSNVAKEFRKAILDYASASRLSSYSMPAAQGYSAMIGASLNMSSEAAAMMYKFIGQFSIMRLKNTLQSDKNKPMMNIVNSSATAARSGLDALGLENTQRGKSATPAWELLMKGAEVVQKTSGLALKLSVANTDKSAGIASFAGYYFDRMKQTHPTETKNMNNEEFWAWANTIMDTDKHTDAVTYADEQVNRSQLIAASQNQSEFYKNRTNWVRVLFPFGKFAYNRKVGIANDISTVQSELASEADKSRAKNRMKSAAAEIATFKLIQPMAGKLAAAAAVSSIASLVGFDDEYDDIVKFMQKEINIGNPLSKEFLKNQFEVSSFKRDVPKEFITSFIDGMLPLPTPGFMNEAGFQSLNKVMNLSGLEEEEFFTVYSKNIRDMFGEPDPKDPVMSDKELVYFLFTETGMVGMAGEDIFDILSTYNALAKNVVANDFSGMDREYTPQVRKAVLALAGLQATQLFVPSADIRRYVRSLKGVLDRKYTQTIKDPDAVSVESLMQQRE